MTLDNNNCDGCSITELNIAIHKSVGDPDSKDANLSWMPYKDNKIIVKNIASKCLVGEMVAQITYTILFIKRNLYNIIIWSCVGICINIWIVNVFSQVASIIFFRL